MYEARFEYQFLIRFRTLTHPFVPHNKRNENVSQFIIQIYLLH